MQSTLLKSKNGLIRYNRYTHGHIGIFRAVVAGLLGFARPGYATTLTWDAGGASPASPADGAGTWDTTLNADWSNAQSDALWNADANSASDTAVFGNNNGAAGTVTLGAAISVGSINFLAAGSGSYTIGNSASNQLTISSGDISVAPSVSATITSPIGGSNGLTVSGGGTLYLGGLGTTSPVAYTGDTTINNSTLQFNNLTTSTAVTLGSGTSNVILSGANAQLNSAIAQSKQFYINANVQVSAATNATVDFSQRTYFGDSSTVALSGTSTSTLRLNFGTTLNRDLFYASANNFLGTLNVQPANSSGGQLVFETVNGSYSSSTTGGFTGLPGTFNVNGAVSAAAPTGGITLTIGALGGASTGLIAAPISGGTTGPVTWSIGALGANTTYAGSIAGNNAINLTGGTLTLTGTNTYSGSTSINGGTLVLNNSGASALGTGTVNVGSLGTLAGTGSFSGALTSAGTISPGSSSAAGVLTATGGTTLSSGATLAETLTIPNVAGGTGGNSLLVATGGLTINPGLTLHLVGVSSIGNGLYHLIDYSIGSLTDNSNAFSGWTVLGLPAGDSYSFSNDTGLGDNGFDSIDVTFNTPEPASLGVAALSGLLLRRRRRRRVAPRSGS